MSHRQTITTICHDGQFWIALIERLDGNYLEIARHVFGAEPSNAELLDWAGRGFADLRFVPASARVFSEPPSNPKRRKREAAAAKARGSASRAQDALKAATELRAVQRKSTRAETRRAVTVRRRSDRVARRKARQSGKA